MKILSGNSLIFSIIIILLAVINSYSQPQQFIIKGTEVREIKSGIDGREYKLFVSLPSSYSTDMQKKYPVVYFCDGFYDFALFTSIHGSGVWDKTISESILVGFAYGGENPNNDSLRRYDYSPTKAMQENGVEEGGGAANFLNIVQNEFIHFVEANYRVDTSFRALGGSSMGGLFTMYAMFTNPGLFNAYMAVSPALIWNNGWLVKYEEEFYKKNKELPVSFFMSVAEFDLPQLPQFLPAVKRMNDILEKRNYENFRYRFHFVEDAHHSGTKPEGYTRAMKFIFAPLMQSDSTSAGPH
ncbi:MAG: alpha/beta hydrolase-fold protein [Ignavibacteriaceae bacterium]